MIRPILAAILVAASATSPAAAEDGAGALSRAATAFYAVTTNIKEGGIPDAKARTRLAPLITPELGRALADGAKAEADYARNTKGEAPPLLEGDLFVSLFEGATAFKVGDCEVHGGAGECTVALSNDASQDSKPVHWSDTVHLVETSSGWRVDDIDYGGNWAFANRGTLRENLAFAIQNARGTGD